MTREPVTEDASSSSMIRMYVQVVIVEAAVVAGLWLLGRVFG